MAFLKSNKIDFSILLLFIAIVLTVPLNAAHKFKHAQKAFKPEVVCDSLPLQVRESSGLLYFNNLLWTFNDSGNEPCLYALDIAGKKVVRKVEIEGAKNIDWEAICSNEEYIFIGDIGNNYGTRSILTVYKINKNDILNSVDNRVNARKITFTYTNFITSVNNKHSEFDAEAMVCIGDSLFVFSKNWKEPYCNIYKIPIRPGYYETPIFKSIYLNGLVTDACYNKKSNTLILLGYNEYTPFLYYIPKLDFGNLNYKTIRRFNYQKLIGFQTEGATFTGDSAIYISSEYNRFLPGTLFKLDVF